MKRYLGDIYLFLNLLSRKEYVINIYIPIFIVNIEPLNNESSTSEILLFSSYCWTKKEENISYILIVKLFQGKDRNSQSIGKYVFFQFIF